MIYDCDKLSLHHKTSDALIKRITELSQNYNSSDLLELCKELQNMNSNLEECIKLYQLAEETRFCVISKVLI